MRQTPALAKARAMRGLSARQLSRKAGLSDETVSRIENGRGTPTATTIGKLARALDMEFDELEALLAGNAEPDEVSA